MGPKGRRRLSSSCYVIPSKKKSYSKCDLLSFPAVCREIIKAYLVSKEIPFPRIHDLLELQKYCLEVDPSFMVIGDYLDVLNPYSIEFRYPGEEAIEEEAKTALKTIKAVRQFVRKRLPLD